MTQHEHGQGEIVTATPAGGVVVPDRPIILYIEGDGTGPDIMHATRPVLDAAVAKAYGDRRRIFWQEVLAGEKAFKLSRSYLPVETLTALREYRVALKGPLTTPIGGGLPVAERHPAPGSGPVCLHPPGALLYRGAQPHEGTGKNRYGDFPGKHRRPLCRYRVGRQHPRGPAPHQFSQS